MTSLFPVPGNLPRLRPALLAAGVVLLLAFLAASAPASTNTAIEAAGLLTLGALVALMSFSANGYLGRDLQITGYAAEALAVLVAGGLLNHGKAAMAAYLLICLSLAHSGAAAVRYSLPALDLRIRKRARTRSGATERCAPVTAVIELPVRT
ncbi:hypothetical protein [Arthrobacter sp. IK3]|uniref:hypothetical protein n=1 Tax=Arthrobacter sp. IK3 TaxID=3448169 RepID=UPI003EE15CE6